MKRIGWLLSAGLRTAVLAILSVAVRLTWSVRTYGLSADRREPSTYYAITHKRDLDSMAPVPPVLLHRGWRAVAADVRFPMRSDAFHRGFLARVVSRPRWLVWALHGIELSGVLRGLGIVPLQDMSQRQTEEWLRDVVGIHGRQRAAEVLAPEVLREMAAAAHLSLETLSDKPTAALMRWRYHAALVRFHGPEALRGEARRTAERAVVARARRYLDDIVDWLRAGHSVYSAPEGRFSRTGHLSLITSGFHRILRAVPDSRVVPIAIMYDFMTAGRPRLFIDMAQPIEQAATLGRGELSERLRVAWLVAARFTCTQLGTGFVVAASRRATSVFTTADMAQAVLTQARMLAAAGRHVDPRLLSPRGARGRVRHYLRYALRHGYVTSASSDAWTARPVDPAVPALLGEAGYHIAPLAYAWNELQDLSGVAISSPAAEGGSALSA